MGFQLPTQPLPGQVHVRVEPVASVTISMDLRKSRASLVPSGETPIPPRSAVLTLPTTDSLLS